MRVLVAEDDPVSSRMLEGLLGNWGYEVEAVRDGGAAYRALDGSGAPPLAIIDSRMPEMDGVEVCRRLRARSEIRPTYVMLLTARDGRDDVVRGLRPRD